ncbi:UDP-N-acetylglucosamine--peptide N-acetylglucosaminyltransferase SPINDLY [Artemisia annua]|uniref:Probable UDP-N-acetylglucosamine--peptide N-acetylglucosaminyltransferase SPINDLY n=1 Tax=Artemisia annua TaxID=35608 RepID=A0A2U1KPW5_ARTAN|nr:UDP-N-acetylglucosamine--peptide N-acetylglucosaminyltransferase SPINDLY [Artemisia annua]
MALPETDVGGGIEDGQIESNGFLKAAEPSLGVSNSTTSASPIVNGYEGNDALGYANILRSRNKFVEALGIYESVLERDSGNVEAHIGKGICLQMQNMGRQAFESFSEAVKLDPQNACALTHCGILYKDEGRLVESAESYRKALEADPSYKPAAECLSIVLTDIGTSLKLAGNTQEGIQKYYDAIKIDPHYAPAYYNLGVVYSEMMQYDTALSCYEKAALERPMYAEAYCNMGAIVFYELAFHFNPHCAEACNNLGVIYKDRDNLDKAVECYQLALSIKPNFSQSLNNLGVVYTVQGKMDAASSMIEKAIVANPTYAEAYNNLGVLYRDAGSISLAIEAYEQCLKIDPDSRNAGQNRLLAMNYINEGTDDKLFEAHRDWGLRFMRLYPQYTSWDNSREPERPLVIGYVSPDYFTHSVSYFIEAPLIYHDYVNYKVVVYSAVVKADAKTMKFKDRVLKRGGMWRDIYGLEEKKVASIVREDKVDILVELTGHTANNKLGMMACRPAPLQVTWIGYPNTTGLPTIDYRITDAMADPPDTKQKHVEDLVRLPDCFLCYTPSPEAGPASPAPALSNGFITFGSFNNLAKRWQGGQVGFWANGFELKFEKVQFQYTLRWSGLAGQQTSFLPNFYLLDIKITPKVLQVWAKILCAVPNSRLIVKCKPFCCDSVRQRFLSTLEQLGLESLRVDLLPLILLNHDHMQAYSLMDISLDTFPYAGTTTTCESLYMGVPCVTMGGSVHAHNVGVSLLSAVGLEHLVAKTEDEYIRLAIQLASDVTALSNLRMDLRNLMANSPLCNGSKFINGLESAYRDMWRGYCKGNIPSLKRMEMLQNQNQTPQITSLLSKDDPFGSIKENGFSLGPPRLLTSGAIEENGRLEHLVAKTEDEYIRLAIQLASDVTALSNLRMDLRNLMANSPLCNGSKFINGLESAYRDMWRGYCKGNIPSLKRMEMLQNQNQTPQITSLLSKDDPFGSIKENGFSLGPPRLLTSGAIEENGSQANQSSSSVQST